MSKGYTPHERFSLKNHPEFHERWVQDLIANDPSILGLGDLILRDRERLHPRAGRLDLLLQDPETKRRYEVELQLGSTDEAHIIRTIEYWDIERKRYPQYDHCAVLIAEDITSRFLNVVSLFNGTIPLVAIQMQALKIGDSVTLVFTTVMDELSRGYIDEDEDAEAAPTDRAYWEKRGSKASVGLDDQILTVAKELDPSLELKYNKFYIGLSKNGQPYNFVTFKPKKNLLNFELKLPQSEDLDTKIEQAGLETLEYSKRWGLYRLRLTKDDIKSKAAILKELVRTAYQRRIVSLSLFRKGGSFAHRRGGVRGFDGTNAWKGRKRYILVDTLGLAIACRVEPANMSDQRGAERLLGGLGPMFPGIRIIMADAGHQSRKLARQFLQQDGWKLVIVKRGQRAFKITGLTTQLRVAWPESPHEQGLRIQAARRPRDRIR